MAAHYNLRTIEELPPGEHLCWLYETEEEYRAVLVPFLHAGLEQEEKVLCIVDSHSAERIITYLQDEEVQVELFLTGGQLIFLTAEATYLREGRFDPQKMIDFLTEATHQTLAEGYLALRVVGEMSWVLRNPPGSHQLIEYERMCRNFFEENHALSICQYNRRRFDSELLLKLLTIHPSVIIGTELFDNFYYIPPEELAAQDSSRVALNHCLDNLVNRKRAEETLKKNEALHRLTLSNISDSIFITDDAGNFTFIYPNADVIFGYTPQEIALLGNVFELLGPNLFSLDTLEAAGEIHNIEREIIDKAGQTHHLLVTVKRVSIDGGTILYTCRDITKRKQMEQSLRENKRRFQAIFDNAIEAILLADGEARYVDANPAACELTGYSREELLQMSVWNLTPELEREQGLELWRDFVKSGEQQGEYLLQRRDGTVLLTHYRAVANILPGLHLSILHDITARKEQEQELIETKNLLEKSFSAIGEAVLVIDPLKDRTIITCNPAAERIFGYSPDELIGRSTQILHVNEETYEEFGRQSEAVLEQRGFFQTEYTLKRKDGQIIQTEHTITPFSDREGGQTGVVGVIRDVTERKRAEEKIQRQAARTEALVESSHLLAQVVSHDTQAVFVTVTRFVAETIGDACVLALLSDDEAWLQPVSFYYPDPAVRSLIEQLLSATPQSTQSKRISHILKTGQPVLVPTLSPEQARQTFQPEYQPYIEKVGISSLLLVPLRLDGKVIGTLGVTRDKPGRPYTLEDQTFLQELADRAALTISNARLLEAERQQRLQAETLREVTLALTSELKVNLVLDEILAQVQRVVPYRTANIMLLQDDGLHIASWRGYDEYGSEAFIATLKQSLQDLPLDRQVIENEEPLVIADTHQTPDWKILEQAAWIRSNMMVPISSKERVLGLLRLDGTTPGEFSREDAELLEPLAASAAIALENAQLFDELHAHRKQLSHLSHQLMEAQETERRHIARELHDEVGQVLTGLKLVLDMSQNVSPAQLNANLKRAQGLVQELIERVDEMSLNLRPPMLDDLGLLPTLLWHFDRYQRQTNIQIVFKHMGLEGARFAPAIEITAYRVIQESLTNIARHAEASEATVRIWVSEKNLGLQVEDEGRGFDSKILEEVRTSRGLSGMRERVELLDGKMSVVSAPGAGTTITVSLPVRE